jgi:hypothetical protein
MVYGAIPPLIVRLIFPFLEPMPAPEETVAVRFAAEVLIAIDTKSNVENIAFIKSCLINKLMQFNGRFFNDLIQ